MSDMIRHVGSLASSRLAVVVVSGIVAAGVAAAGAALANHKPLQAARGGANEPASVPASRPSELAERIAMRLCETKARIAQLQATVSAFQASLDDPSGPAIPPELLASRPAVARIDRRIADLKLELNTPIAEFDPQSRSLLAVRHELALAQDLLRALVDSHLAAMRVRLAGLHAMRDSYEQSLAGPPSATAPTAAPVAGDTPCGQPARASAGPAELGAVGGCLGLLGGGVLVLPGMLRGRRTVRARPI